MAEARLSIYALLAEIRQSSPAWQPGEPLHRLQLSEFQLRSLERVVVTALTQSVSSLPGRERAAWGAAMMLLGARTYQRLGDNRCTYAELWKTLGANEFAHKNPLRNAEYNLMERGCQAHWGIKIKLGLSGDRLTRLFQTTMILNSGAGWGVLLAVCVLVEKFWSWESLLSSRQTVIEEWLSRQRAHMGSQQADFLADEERRVATAERLSVVGRGRDLLLDKRLVATTYEDTLRRLNDFDLTPVTLFGAPSEVAAADLLKRLFPFSKERPTLIPGPPQYYWDTDSQNLCLELPRCLSVRELPVTLDRLTVLIPGISHQVIAYQRQEHLFIREQPISLTLPEHAHWPLEVHASYEWNELTREKSMFTLPFPGKDVALFGGPEGFLQHKPVAQAPVVLVCAPGLCLTESPEGRRFQQQGLQMWRGTLRPGINALRLTAPDGEVLEHPLETGHPPLRVETVGTAVNGLTFKAPHGARVQSFCAWPEFQLLPPLKSGTFSLETSDGRTQQGRYGLQGNRVRLDLATTPTAPGLYSLQLDQGERTGGLTFALLPHDARFSIQPKTSGTQLRASQVRLRWKNLTGHQELLIPPSVQGPQRVEVILPNISTLPDGRWDVIASPVKVELIGPDGKRSLPPHNDLRLLQKGGGLMVCGPRGAAITRQLQRDLQTRSYEALIPASGERFLPWNELEPRLRSAGLGKLLVHVRIEQEPEAGTRSLLTQETLEFEDCSTLKPTIRTTLERGKSVLQLSFPWRAFDKPSLLLIPMDRPWEVPQRTPCEMKELASPGRESARMYSAVLAGPLPPSYVALMDGDERLSGFASTSPTHRSMKLCWEKLLQPPHSAQARGLFQNLSRYGADWLPELRAALVQYGTGLRLSALLLQKSEPPDVLKVFRLARVSPMAIRYADLDHLVERELLNPSRASSRHCLEALRLLEEDNVGLSVRVLQRLFARAEAEPELREELLHRMTPWLTLVQSRPEQLPGAAIEALEDSGDPSVPVQCLDPWARALLKTRQRMNSPTEVEPAMVQEWPANVSTPPAQDLPAAWSWHSALVSRLPVEIQTLNHEILHQARKLHRWREGASVHIDWKELDSLRQRYPELVNYWLNRWAIEPPS